VLVGVGGDDDAQRRKKTKIGPVIALASVQSPTRREPSTADGASLAIAIWIANWLAASTALPRNAHAKLRRSEGPVIGRHRP
jgi:hypothetical protein